MYRKQLARVLLPRYSGEIVEKPTGLLRFSYFKLQGRWTIQRSLHATPCVYSNRNQKTLRKLEQEKRRHEKLLEKQQNKRVALIKGTMTVEEAAKAYEVTVEELIAELERRQMVRGSRYMEEEITKDSILTGTQFLHKLSKMFGFNTTRTVAEETKIRGKDLERQNPPDPDKMVPRPPVVTIMGHVDHGKTSLLDALRKSNIVDKEFGGITQHIGAFSVKLASGHQITFLDTPGHAAFTAMRARGANVTDILVLVIAADDGVMPQTIESIELAKSAGVPLIVAINKIDLHEADVDRTIRNLMEHDVIVEEYGGDVQYMPISAKKGTNLKELQEKIATLAEVLELKGDHHGLVEGYILESKQDRGRGKLATVLVKRGVLEKGKILVAGRTLAKVKSLYDENGRPVQSAPPSMAVEVTGWQEIPSAGDEVLEASTEKKAKNAIEYRTDVSEELRAEEARAISEVKNQPLREQYLELRRRKGRHTFTTRKKMFKKTKEEFVDKDRQGPNLPVIIKGDVMGSLEAIVDTMSEYDSRKCRLDIMEFDVGNITLSDIKTAGEFNGVVYGFNVQCPAEVQDLADSLGVSVRLHNVIYKLFDDLLEELNVRLPLVEEDDVIGEAQVLQHFTVIDRSTKEKLSVGGCRCVEGSLQRDSEYRVERDGELVYSGKLKSLKHVKEEVSTIKEGRECGIVLEDTDFEFKPGDIVKCVNVKSIKQQIDWQPRFVEEAV